MHLALQKCFPVHFAWNFLSSSMLVLKAMGLTGEEEGGQEIGAE